MSEWVTVNRRWEEIPDVGPSTRFIAAVNKARAVAEAANKHLVLTEEERAWADEAIGYQDRYPWIRTHLAAKDPEAWYRKAEYLVMSAEPGHRAPLRALAKLRYAYRLESLAINNDPEVQETQQEVRETEAKSKAAQFKGSEACATGVLLEVRGSDGSVRQVLLGDTTPSGLDDGCCTSGLSSADMVLRYRDFRKVIYDQS